MFHGPIAAAGLLDPPAAPTGAATLDFLAGTYVINGASYAASDIVSNPDRIGASGLQILDFTANQETSILGDLLALVLTANWTATFEWEQVEGDHWTEFLFIGASQDETGSVYLSLDRKFPSGGAFCVVSDEDASLVYREAADDQEILSGVHKVSVTVTDLNLAISVDGGAATSDTAVSAKDGLDNASFGGPASSNEFTGFYLRKLTIQAPVVDADLPSLSA